MIERRLSWETLDPWLCDELKQKLGKQYWPMIVASGGDVQFADRWHKTTVIFSGDERMDQYRTLKLWADTNEQPIRNVAIEERTTLEPDEGWRQV